MYSCGEGGLDVRLEVRVLLDVVGVGVDVFLRGGGLVEFLRGGFGGLLDRLGGGLGDGFGGLLDRLGGGLGDGFDRLLDGGGGGRGGLFGGGGDVGLGAGVQCEHRGECRGERSEVFFHEGVWLEKRAEF